jgi:hypothetical protein
VQFKKRRRPRRLTGYLDAIDWAMSGCHRWKGGEGRRGGRGRGEEEIVVDGGAREVVASIGFP